LIFVALNIGISVSAKFIAVFAAIDKAKVFSHFSHCVSHVVRSLLG
jgi:hypothetical protein